MTQAVREEPAADISSTQVPEVVLGGFHLRDVQYGSTEVVTDRGVRVWWMATGLMAVMAALFVSSSTILSTLPWIDLVRAFSEAALVGALADWFAVTALFRRPLGLPIPHT